MISVSCLVYLFIVTENDSNSNIQWSQRGPAQSTYSTPEYFFFTPEYVLQKTFYKKTK